MRVRDHFITRVKGFLGRHGLSKSAFGRLALGDREFVGDLELGKPLALSRIEKAEAFMAEIDADPAVLTEKRRQAGMTEPDKEPGEVAAGGAA